MKVSIQLRFISPSCLGAAFAFSFCLTMLGLAGCASRVDTTDFSPPPVPDFMFQKQTGDLNIEQMKAQAERAVQASRNAAGPKQSP